MNLVNISQGDPVACRRLLHNARFEGLATEAFGTDAISELLRSCSVPWVGGVQTVDQPRFAAAFGQTPDGPAALFADVYCGHVARLWLLSGERVDYPPAGRTAVPADFDRDQRGAVVAFDAAEHPALDAAHVERVARLGRGLVVGTMAFPFAGKAHARVRPVVLRAISDGDRTAVLMVVQSLRDRHAGGVCLTYAAALLGADEVFVADAAMRQTAP